MKSKRWILVSAIIAVLGVLLFSGVFTPEVLASEHGAEGGNPLNPLESIRGDLALWTAVTFLVVLAILWKFAWGPIMAGLDKRESYVHAQRTDAEKANADAKALHVFRPDNGAHIVGHVPHAIFPEGERDDATRPALGGDLHAHAVQHLVGM